jgi:mitogen-activated protein kinase
VNIQGNLKICDFGLARGISSKYLKQKPNCITNYVATRWYRAPELLLSRRNYAKAVDMWAVGCIFAELYGRRPLFAGNDQIHQVAEILKILGTPTKQIILKYGTSLAWDLFSPPNPQFKPMIWAEVLPYASCSAHDLLGRLLCWDTGYRYTVLEAISHPFLKPVRDINDEAVSAEVFDFSFENSSASLNDYKILMHDEVNAFRMERVGEVLQKRKGMLK